MKKLLSLVLALAVCAGLALVPASAIEVQLNGANMTFTDAVPQVKDQRTFLPFRAVFEALGAQVDYEGDVITAVRGDVTVTMTIGSTEAKVSQAGAERTVTMDVAPYVDAETWRTYVPVRFAAQAMNCAVGWDQEEQTAIVIDPSVFIDKATEGLSFTKLEALGKALDKFNEGIWDLAMDLNGTVSVMGIAVPITGSMTGTADETGTDLTMEMATSLLDQNIDVSMQFRQDKDAGKVYLNLGGAMAASMNADADTWYEMDLDAIDSEADAAKTASDAVLNSNALSSVRDYEDCLVVLHDILQFVSDDALQLGEEGDYISTFSTDLDGVEVEAALGLVQKDQEINGADLLLGLDAKESGAAALTVHFDADGAMEMMFYLESGGEMPFSVNLETAGQHTPGTAAPQIAPPEGATVVPFDQLTEAADGQ